MKNKHNHITNLCMDKTKTGYQIYGGTKRLALTYRGTGANYIETKTDLIEKLPYSCL